MFLAQSLDSVRARISFIEVRDLSFGSWVGLTGTFVALERGSEKVAGCKELNVL